MTGSHLTPAATLLCNARVVDGTGVPVKAADVLVSDERIVDVGPGLTAPSGAASVDLDGLVLSPGFIDPHTHFDAQVLWDRDLTPSSWYGVTTVIAGNCGFTLAPNKPAIRDHILLTLETVEGMPIEALREGITWNFETFPEMLDALAAEPLRLNYGAYVGHSAVRWYVMGDEATEREATADETAQMAAIVADAVDAGAFGFSTGRLTTDVGAFGKPVPSRLASQAELLELARATGAAGPRVIQFLAPKGTEPQDLVDLAVASGGTLLWGPAISARWGDRGVARALLEELDRLGGSRLVGQTHTLPITQEITFRDPNAMCVVSPAFEEVLALPRQGEARRNLYQDPAWRRRVWQQMNEGWDERINGIEVSESTSAPEAVGRTVGELARQRGVDPLEAMVELSLAEDLEVRFRLSITNHDDEELADLLQDPRTMPCLSDAGAHQSQICDAGYGLRLLGKWVRDLGVLDLEDAVHRLTGQPARVFGIADRGTIRPGAFADLVAFDPDTVTDGPLERVYDQPAGADRLVRRASGIHHVWVNGTSIRADGEDLPVRPGRLLRAG